jgi:hypothetical protein
MTATEGGVGATLVRDCALVRRALEHVGDPVGGRNDRMGLVIVAVLPSNPNPAILLGTDNSNLSQARSRKRQLD